MLGGRSQVQVRATFFAEIDDEILEWQDKLSIEDLLHKPLAFPVRCDLSEGEETEQKWLFPSVVGGDRHTLLQPMFSLSPILPGSSDYTLSVFLQKVEVLIEVNI